MIEKDQILKIAEKAITSSLSERGIVITSIELAGLNQITILIDNYDGIRIDDCVTISKGIENELDRETEDFELMVSSAGLTSPFTVPFQYKKNINKEIEIISKDGKKTKSVLLSVHDDFIEIERKEKKKVEGQKKKQEIINIQKLMFSEIKSAKAVF